MKPEVQINTILGEVEKTFPQYHADVLDDPETTTVKYLRVYGVPDYKKADVRETVWDIIERFEEYTPDFEFVPSIVSEEETKKYYKSKEPEAKIHDSITRRFFICNCEDIDHQLCVEYIPGYGEIGIRVLLNKSGSFWHRLGVAWRYLFGPPCRFGFFDEINLDKPRIRSFINYLQEVEDIQYNKEREYDKG